MIDHQVLQEEFEAWARSHGSIDLTLARAKSGQLVPKTSDGTLSFATYYKRETELAWRAWANRRP